MGLFGSITRGIGKVIGGVGDVVKKVAPVTALIPGVGAIASGALGAGGALLGTLNDKKPSLGGAIRDAALYGGGSYLANKAVGSNTPASLIGKAGGLLGIGGGANPGAARPTDMGGMVPGGGIKGAIAGAMGGAPGSGGKGIGGIIGGAANWLTGEGQASENRLRALGMLGGAAGAYMQGQSEDAATKFAQDQVNYARERNASFDPIRMQLLTALMQQKGVGGAPAKPGGPVPVGTGMIDGTNKPTLIGAASSLTRPALMSPEAARGPSVSMTPMRPERDANGAATRVNSFGYSEPVSEAALSGADANGALTRRNEYGYSVPVDTPALGAADSNGARTRVNEFGWSVPVTNDPVSGPLTSPAVLDDGDGGDVGTLIQRMLARKPAIASGNRFFA